MANNTGQKYGGREAGTPNRLTKELRAVLKNILHQEIELLPEHFNKLEPKDRLELLVKLLPYALPKVYPESYQIGEGGIADSWD
jgi:hypothetical protein